LTLLLGKLEGL